MTNGEQQQRSDNCALKTVNPKPDKKQPSNPAGQQQQAANKIVDRPLPVPRQQPPVKQVRPVRPGKVRRQAVLVAAGSGIPLGVSPVGVVGQQPANETSIELAGVIPRNMLPPKRPAHLPARYEGTYRAPMATGGACATAGKPNRYMWAHWPPPPTGQHPAGSLPGQGGEKAGHLHSHPHHHHSGFHHHFAAPFSSAASRVMVVNPMQIVNLSEHTKSRLIKFIEAIKRFSEKWFSHVLLLLFLAVYACLGAYIFISFEAPTEQWEKQMIIDSRQKMVNDSFNEATSKNREQFNELFIGKLEDYERLLSRACASGMSSSSLENQWTFWGALFYSMTVFTTIGYGHLTPITFAGRVATMIYAIFGIPILLMVLADLGKLLTRIIKYAFKKFRCLFNKLLRKKSSLKTRKLISDNTNQYIGVARGALERGVAYIQPQYQRIPDAFRSSSLSRRFCKRTQQQVLESDYIATSGDTAGDELQQQQQPDEEGGERVGQPEAKAADVESTKKAPVTDVIVTPIKQMKPVSPKASSEKRPFPLQVSDNNHGHQHHGSQHHHQHHNHHGHGNRGQSPGAQSKRKTSTTFSAGTLSRRVAKGSVSRSSSSSQMVIGSTSGLERRSKQVANQVSSELPSTVAAQPVSSCQPDEPTVSSKLPAVETNTIQASDRSKPVIGTDSEATGVVGETEFVSGDEELEEVDITANEDDDESEEDEFDIPVSFALFLLVTYMMFGAVVFSIWEGWNFFDSLYFVFISMSTIGFGDLVPQHPKRMIGTFIYLLFGLALTSMCINVVQEKIHATFLRAKMQIGEKMGLDLEQIMADDYYTGDGSIGTEGDEDDSNSVAVSQTNSSFAQICPADQDLPEQGGIDCHHMGKLASLESGSSEGIKTSKSKDSLRSATKRRTVAGLPGHNSHNNSLRRKPSKKNQMQRQTTPSGASSLSSPSTEQAPSQATCIGQQVVHSSSTTNQPVVTNKQPQRVQIEVLQEKTEQLVGINHPIDERAKRHCEPLAGGMSLRKSYDQQVAGPQLQQYKLMPTIADGGSLATGGHSAVAKSLSSDARFNRTNRIGGSTRSRPTARSADSSLRSSVSFELNQLDDLIVALSQSPSERFGPLLGIPINAPSASNSSSPSTSLSRRATSMINKPASRNHLDRSMLNEASNKGSIVQYGSPAAALLKISPPPPVKLTDSQKANADRIKFSAM